MASLTDSDYTRANVPPISAIELNLEQLALLAVELMLRRLEGQPPPARPIELPPFTTGGGRPNRPGWQGVGALGVSKLVTT